MKIILGVDLGNSYRYVLRLMQRLDFADASLTLLHAAESPLTVPTYDGTRYNSFLPNMIEANREAGHRALDEALTAAGELGCVDKVLRTGTPAGVLLETASSEDADLLAIGAEPKGRFASWFAGSVGKALAVSSDRSVLIGKPGTEDGEGPITAVFGVDHSDYNRKALDRFLEMKPQGLGKLVLVSAFNVSDYELSLLRSTVPALGDEAEEWITQEVRRRTEAIAETVGGGELEVETMVERGHANDVLRRAMEEHRGDLLVLGAKGRGWMDRMLIGSVSLHQALAEKHSTLIVRA
jgi:nucleotide-binding universal stress UspA family protein